MSQAVSDSYAEAAEVCLDRHHKPPLTQVAVQTDGKTVRRDLAWRGPSTIARRAWNNRDDATRDAAYIVSLSAIESEVGLVALARAETRTGADYYVGMKDAEDLEQAHRLEVSGVDSGTESDVRRRLSQKVDQAAQGRSHLPAMASVVGFKVARVLVAKVSSRP